MEANTIMVSISCTAFNHERYIRDALEGFINQKTNFRFEVLVHDDASTDSTPDIIREYEKKYPDIIKPIYQKENQYSQHVSIKEKFEIPRLLGKYVAVCEGDDYWTDPYKLQKQVDFMEAHPEYSLCGTACTWYNMRDDVETSQFLIAEDRDVSVDDIILEKNGRIFPTVSVLTRKEVYMDIPNWMTKFSIGDTPLFINAGMKGKIRMLADNTCVYRWYAAGSWTISMTNEAKNLNFKERFVEGLQCLDEETNFRYTDYIKDRIHREMFDVAVLKKDWCTLKSPEYRDEWRKRSLKNKISLFLTCKMPKMYSVLRRLKHGEKR